MRFGLIRSDPLTHWGGDLKTLSAIARGLNELGHEARVYPSPAELPPVDFIFLANTFRDLRPEAEALRLMRIPYGVIPFYEDLVKFGGASSGFFAFVRGCLDGVEEKGVPLTIERLEKLPHVIYYYSFAPPHRPFVNEGVLQHAACVIANTPTEAATIRRDCPEAKVHTCFWPPGFAEEFGEQAPTGEFLEWTGLASGEYIIQIGRPEFRKNQLATILATRHLDIPLVLIMTRGGVTPNPYLTTVLEAVVRWRRAPTWIIGQDLPHATAGRHQILPMPGGEPLSASMLHSAIAHAGLHLHPAFYELPGATYLESAALGIPTIASSWTTVADYFRNPPLEDGRIAYAEPYDIATLAGLVTTHFGRRYPRSSHPAFRRTRRELARELAEIVTHSMV
jgi:glycosyltransferase involved in cell wall biosynthesis